MKWLSVKTHVPPTGTPLFIRINKDHDRKFQYERYLIAQIESYTTIDDLKEINNWHLFENAINSHYEYYHVTHFAIIDAVEWE